MTYLGHWDHQKFKADFPLDFGHGVRGDWLLTGTRKVGVIVVHKKDDVEVCGGAVYWDHGPKKWEVKELDPLTLIPSVLCSCGMHGFITEGEWQKL